MSELCHNRSYFYCRVLPGLKIQGSAKSQHAPWQTLAVLGPDFARPAAGEKPAATAPGGWQD